MSPERTGEDWSPEDAPDWFEAEENGDESADPSTGEHDWLDDGAAEGWFDDPDHRPIDIGDEPIEESVEPDPGGAFDGESGASEGTAGAAESTDQAGAGTSEREKSGTAVTTDEPGTGADQRGPPENTPEAVASPPGSDDGRTDTRRGDERETGEGTDREADTPERDDRGTDTDDRTASETDETGETGETEDAGSYVHRVLAWLRSVVGRLA